jgi:hypothetical protein
MHLLSIFSKVAIGFLVASVFLQLLYFVAYFKSDVSNMKNKDMWAFLLVNAIFIGLACVFLFLGYKKDEITDVPIHSEAPKIPRYNKYKFNQYKKKHHKKEFKISQEEVEDVDTSSGDDEIDEV